MAIYFCKVTDKSGKMQEFVRESSSPDTLSMELQTKGFIPVIIKETTESQEKATKTRFSKKSIIEFTDTICLLINSGLSLKDALGVAQTIFIKGQENEIIVQMLGRLQKGMAFHRALDDFGTSFSPLYRNMVKIGEKVGSLDNIFSRLSRYLQDGKKIREKIIGALIYPLLIMVLIIVGLFFMTIFVFPTLRQIFSQLGADIAQDINSLLATFNVLIVSLLGLIISSIIAFIFLTFIRRREGKGAQIIDRFFIKIPIAGRVIIDKECMNFLFAMETLTASGYSLEEGLEEAKQVLKNQALKQVIINIREQVIKGDSIAEAFLNQSLFPERIGRWLAVGERSGNVEKVFTQLSHYYQGEIEKWSTRFMTWIEPVLMITVGVFIVMFVILFIIPIFSMYLKIM